jgi:hypothetical protein
MSVIIRDIGDIRESGIYWGFRDIRDIRISGIWGKVKTDIQGKRSRKNECENSKNSEKESMNCHTRANRHTLALLLCR